MQKLILFFSLFFIGCSSNTGTFSGVQIPQEEKIVVNNMEFSLIDMSLEEKENIDFFKQYYDKAIKIDRDKFIYRSYYKTKNIKLTLMYLKIDNLTELKETIKSIQFDYKVYFSNSSIEKLQKMKPTTFDFTRNTIAFDEFLEMI